jgi:beta-lactamase class A
MTRRMLAPGLLAIFAMLAAPVAAQSPAAPAPLDRLRSNIERITRGVNARWGVYVKCLETGEEIALGADEPMDTMSVIKIPLMVETYRQVEAGKFKLDDRYTLKDEDKRPGTGVIRTLDAGASLTIKDLITLMNTVSDNTATDVLFARVGGVEPVNALMSGYGLSSIRATGTTDVWFKALRESGDPAKFHAEAKTPFGLASPRDIGRLLEKIARGEAVSPKASEAMLAIMRQQVSRSRIPRYVTGYAIPHKTGDFLPYIGNDVGLLESPGRRIVLVIFTAKHYGSGANLEDAIGRVAEQVADYYGTR